MANNVVIVAAHPDDEILGCGGAIANHVKQGDAVHVLILAEGLTSRSEKRNSADHNDALSELAQAAKRANHVLGVASLTLLQFPDNRMDSVDRLDVIKQVEGFVNQHKPTIIYTHHAGDVNIDHRCVHDAVVTACRPQPRMHQVSTLLFFETVSSTEWQPPHSAPNFLPNWFVNISDTLALKLQALNEYQSEMREWPHPRSIKAVEHLSRWRGAIIGVEAGEAFMLGRNII